MNFKTLLAASVAAVAIGNPAQAFGFGDLIRGAAVVNTVVETVNTVQQQPGPSERAVPSITRSGGGSQASSRRMNSDSECYDGPDKVLYDLSGRLNEFGCKYIQPENQNYSVDGYDIRTGRRTLDNKRVQRVCDQEYSMGRLKGYSGQARMDYATQTTREWFNNNDIDCGKYL